MGIGGAVGCGDQAETAFGEDFQAEVAASFCPFIGLLGQNGPDETDNRFPVGEDPDRISAAPDLAVQPFGGLFDQICCQTSVGKLVNARMSALAASR